MHTRVAFSLLAIILSLSACGETQERYRESDGRACVKRALSNQFLVKYKDQDQVQRLMISREKLNRLLEQDDIEWAEPNYQIPVPEVRVDPGRVRGASQSTPNIAAEYAWARGYTGQGVRIAVVDSGVDINHPFLRRALRRGSDEYIPSGGRSDGVDNDGNGFIDDLYGWNFAENRAEVIDETGHGTHIAGIIAGSHSEFSQFRGVAPGSAIIAADFMNGEVGDEYSAIRAIDYSLNRGARVINNSWTNFCSISLRSAFESWQSHNVVFVNAAGNDGLHIDSLAIFPANLNFSNTITVGSMGKSGRRSSFSNHGANVMIYAPGEEIFSLAIAAFGYDHLIARSGTSMSTAFVSGAVALAWSAYPEKNASQIVAALRRQARPSQASGVSKINVRELFQALNN